MKKKKKTEQNRTEQQKGRKTSLIIMFEQGCYDDYTVKGNYVRLEENDSNKIIK